MKAKTIKKIGFPLLIVGVINIAFMFYSSSKEVQATQSSQKEVVKKQFADLDDDEKKEAVEAIKRGDCEYKGIELHGKVQFVTSFPDIKIQYVTSFPDIKVKFVSSFPDDCGEWQEVTSFPDFKVQIVTSFPDLKVEKVSSFPGMR
ncbi:MAG: hypothetical protein ACI85I_000413 [Arenicella sp.]|jgi:hypothetical protein